MLTLVHQYLSESAIHSYGGHKVKSHWWNEQTYFPSLKLAQSSICLFHIHMPKDLFLKSAFVKLQVFLYNRAIKLKFPPFSMHAFLW